MRAYQSTFSVDGPVDEVAPAVRDVMVAWAEKKHRRKLGPDGLGALAPGMRLQPHPGLELLMTDTREELEDRVFGFVVVERHGVNSWASQVMVVGGPRLGDRSLIAVETDSPPSPKDPLRPKTASVPRFVRTMLERFECDDAGIHLSNSPQVLGVEDVPGLLKELGETDHHGLVLVAGAPEDRPLPAWTKFIGNITKGTVGQAATYILDEAATSAFNGGVCPQHAVPGGALRSFAPGALFEEPDDGARHRLLAAQTLADDKLRKKAGQVLERRIRAFTNDRELERRTRRYLWILGQHFDEIVFRTPQQREIGAAAPADGALPTTAPAEDTAQLHARAEELATLLAARNKDLDEAKKELARARDTIGLLEQRNSKREQDDEALREELRLRTDERDELNVDYAVALDDKDRALGRAEKAEREVQRLRTVLSRIGHAEEAWDTPEEDEPDLAQPSDWLELATWAGNGELARALPRVDFTCDWDRALDLDDQNNLTWIATTWDILRALNDYGRARADESVTVRNLHEYLSAPPEGFRTVPRGRYKPTESETVENRQRYRKERTFPVPEQVPDRDDNGRLYMDRHFVIATAGIVSPRLYFHDATDVPGYGKVVVGYIGRHLTNGQTN